MLEIEHYATESDAKMEMIIDGMRNPLSSWAFSDSDWVEGENGLPTYKLGPKDLKLAKSLALNGGEHAKYRRMINVVVAVNAPLYWWKEMDTYKIGTVANSCSTMHTIQKEEFSTSMFSDDHLMEFNGGNVDDIPMVSHGLSMFDPRSILTLTIKMLNACREKFLKTKGKETSGKDYWWQMIQLLPTSWMQFRTVSLNYEVLSKIHQQRSHHKLDEWHVFCEWIEELPYFDTMIRPDLYSEKRKES